MPLLLPVIVIVMALLVMAAGHLGFGTKARCSSRGSASRLKLGHPRPKIIPPEACGAAYVPFAQVEAASAVVVDCTHPVAPTFTHHKGQNNPADTSTGLVLNALHSRCQNAAIDDLLGRPAVAVNHFDGDALFSVWTFSNPRAALRHEAVLRCAAALHDFREAAGLGGPAGGTTRIALSLCCWINSIERARFSPPYDDKDADDKFAFFLKELGPFLEDPGAYREEWAEEYEGVLREWRLLGEGGAEAVTVDADVGVAVVRAPRPVHYYALFSHTLGCDAVVSVYGDASGDAGSFEVEQKYTQFVSVHSRPVQARLDMGPLAAALNRLDSQRAAGTAWGTPRMVDTGPLLRLNVDGQKLSKKERYGQPSARPMHRSGLTAAQFGAVALSFFRHGLRNVPPRVGGWSWEALHELNAGIDWEGWEAGLGVLLS